VQGISSLLTTGLGPTFVRNCVWNSIYLSTLYNVEAALPTASSDVEAITRKLGLGIIVGMFATCFNAPFDVVKSRFQSQLTVPGALPKYRSTFQALKLIYQEEGFQAMYRGLAPKAVRLGIGQTVGLLVFEQLIVFQRRRLTSE
jgi:solute carrier family 25 2-oxodicarboxylate transporter 21